MGPERARRVVFFGDRFPPRGARADEDLRARALSRLRDRVAALDGRLRVDSPPRGGPTTIIAELPCV
ncbi:hypothetical protein PUR28_26680 [Streptomyces sp. BE308]|uniref:hypothetical protein n=1 Tax=Streptomyces sp. BE308 TaxID=3002529 RepID=UPI002E79286C|nr:hypothetical protein [Streptomyces sp. BE308]MEE1794316.1 hypothetical protein [Streptomyces sp. BE308]